MTAYANGRLPDSALASIPGGGRLLAAVAVTWSRICAEVQQQHGWTPTPTSASDAYRSYAIQEKVFRERYTTAHLAGRPYKVWAGQRWYQRPGTAQAAVPGTSNHGWACAVDVESIGPAGGARYRQFAAVAARYGWTNTEGASIGEPWHWVDVGNAHLISNGLTTVGVSPVATPELTVPNSPKETDMPWTQAEWERLDRLIHDRIVAHFDQLYVNASKAHRPLLIRCKDGRIVADVGTGYRVVTAEQWQVWTNLGRATIDPDLSAMDPAPFESYVASLGGIVTHA